MVPPHSFAPAAVSHYSGSIGSPFQRLGNAAGGRPSAPARLVVIAVVTLMGSLASCRADRPRTDFDAARAMEYVAQQLDFGPRVPGTEGHRRTGDWIVEHMRSVADTVMVEEWTHVTVNGDSLPMRNILARFRPSEKIRVLYLAHWDTRPIADNESDPVRRATPIPGANDGASGVALLMAVADELRRAPPSVGVDLLFVDGEDYGDWSDPEHPDVLIGSRHFATNLPDENYFPIFGVLFDMIGDRELNIMQELNSLQGAPEVVRRVWTVARELGREKYFIPQPGHAVLDDHIPLLERGLRVINVIDIDYGSRQKGGRPNYHHTLDDTIDKVSARSLQVVGDVAVTLVR